MKFNRIPLLVGIALLASASSAWAIPVISVEQATVPASATSTDITISHTEASPNTTQAGSFNVVYDTAKLSSNAVAVCAGLAGTWSCSELVLGTIVFVSGFADSGNLVSFSADFSFDLTSADKPSVNPLNVTNPLYLTGDSEFTNPNVTNGSITINPPLPDADFSPNAGALDLGSAPQSTTASTIVTIDNVGPTGSLLDASCSITTNSTVFSVTNGTVTDLTAAAAPHEVTVGCNSPNIQVHNGVMTCTHDGDGTTDGSPLIYNLSCTMTEGPTPQYSSAPIAAGGTFEFGNPVKDTANPELSTGISNTGDMGTSLDSAGCTITSNPNNAYMITAGSGGFNLATTDPARTVTVSCDTAIAGDHDGGMLSCPHNGSNTGTPVTYALNCQVDPVPTFTATPTAITPASIPQNNTPYPLGQVLIENEGDVGSNLSGSCTLVNPVGTAIEFTSGSAGSYSLAKDASKAVGVQCNSTALPGVHSAEVSCTENDPNFEGPSVTPFSCTVGQPDPAIYASDPASGATIDITNGVPAPSGSDNPTAPLAIWNDAEAGDANMRVSCGLIPVTPGDNTNPISASPDVSPLVLSPGVQNGVDVTFTCDTATVGQFEATYRCDYESVFVNPFDSYSAEGQQEDVPPEYTVTCEVREGKSQVTPDPADGTPQSKVVEPGGMQSFFFTFSEDFGEGVNASLESCSLEDGTNFEIVSPASFPVVIPGDGAVVVEVKGTDPGGVESFGDELTCMFADTDNSDPLGSVTYQLTLQVGGDARFTVMKDFTDGNPGDVTVDLDCDTGLILDQEKIISEDGIGVTFVVTDFDTGELNCNVTERVVAGYSADYEASGDSANTDSDDAADGCFYTLVTGGDENLCTITNSPDAVDVVITKEWLYPGSADGSTISDNFSLTLYCENASIEGGVEVYDGETVEGPSGSNGDECGYFFLTNAEGGQADIGTDLWCKTLSGSGNTVFTEKVTPYKWPGGQCYATEPNVDPAVEVDNGCMGSGQGLFVMDVSVGSGDSCTITNTVFYEGIPTLSEYGMALLALLMLGMGFVAVRRVS